MPQSPSVPQQKHIVSFDYLRVLASFFVVLLHVSSLEWYNLGGSSSAWRIFNLANSATRWAVPAFLMMSGSIHLNPERPLDLSKLWRVRIFRLFVVFVFWSGIYALDGLSRGDSLTVALQSFLGGEYHMWYLTAQIGLYMMTPLLRRITDSRKLTEYFLIAAFCFVVLFPRTLHLLGCLNIPFLAGFLPSVEKLLFNFGFDSEQSCLLYFVLGYYLVRYPVSALSTRNCLLLILVGYLTIALPNDWYGGLTGEPTTAFMARNGLNVLCMSVGCFQLVQNLTARFSMPEKLNSAVRSLAKTTFGIYLIHPLVLDRMVYWGLTPMSFHPVLSVPCITLLAFAISWVLAILLQRIPFVKDYLI